MAFPRVIHKGLGVYWGVPHCNSGHSTSQAAWVALVFGFTLLCIYLCYRSYTKTPPLHLPLAPRFHLCGGVVLSTRLFYIPNYNIPSTLNLMKEIWTLPHPSPTDTPTSGEVWRCLNIFSKLLQYFTLPYINIYMGLYEQLQSLSTVAHLAVLLYMHANSQNAFIQSQLYQDTQIAIKNVYFCIAKTKQDNPSGKFFIYQLGSDRLEWIFGWIQSQSEWK